MRRRLTALWLVCALALSGCGARRETQDDGRLRVVATLFPYYDFARAVAGDRASVSLLLAPGREAHSFEPTPLDAVAVAEADVFLYNGGESEEWVDDLLGAVGEGETVVRRLIDSVETEEEEFVEGMQQSAGGHEHEHEDEEEHEHEDERARAHGHVHGSGDGEEADEHVWTDPGNAVLLCRSVCEALCEADGANAQEYCANCERYCEQLSALDDAFAALRARAVRSELVFAGRMPMLYFCHAYDLDYRAAFHGCSTDTEPSLYTLKYLIDRVSAERIPVVYTVDLDSDKIAKAVSECTGAAIDTLYSLQTVSRADFAAGETYVTLMQRNLRALEGGLL